MKNGEIYRGMLLSAEETMNLSLSDVLRTTRNGQITKLPSVYLRGSSIRFIALPDLLKNAPVFQKVTMMKRKMEQEQEERQQGTCEKRDEDSFLVFNSWLSSFLFQGTKENVGIEAYQLSKDPRSKVVTSYNQTMDIERSLEWDLFVNSMNSLSSQKQGLCHSLITKCI